MQQPAGIYYGKLWACLQMELFLMNPAFGHRSCVTACKHTLVSISRFAGVLGKISTGLLLKCKSMGVG